MLALILFIVLLISVGFWGRSKEKEDWNKGICKSCGTKWHNFDTDSQGGRGYVCETRKHWTWISYGVDR